LAGSISACVRYHRFHVGVMLHPADIRIALGSADSISPKTGTSAHCSAPLRHR
jgi:hypothetical protein